MHNSPASRPAASDRGGERTVETIIGGGRIGVRAKVAWSILAFCVLLGVVLFLRYGATVIPLIHETR